MDVLHYLFIYFQGSTTRLHLITVKPTNILTVINMFYNNNQIKKCLTVNCKGKIVNYVCHKLNQAETSSGKN